MQPAGSNHRPVAGVSHGPVLFLGCPTDIGIVSNTPNVAMQRHDNAEAFVAKDSVRIPEFP